MGVSIKHLCEGNVKIGSYWWHGDGAVTDVSDEAVIAKCRNMRFLRRGKDLPRFELISDASQIQPPARTSEEDDVGKSNKKPKAPQ